MIIWIWVCWLSSIGSLKIEFNNRDHVKNIILAICFDWSLEYIWFSSLSLSLSLSLPLCGCVVRLSAFQMIQFKREETEGKKNKKRSINISK